MTTITTTLTSNQVIELEKKFRTNNGTGSTTEEMIEMIEIAEIEKAEADAKFAEMTADQIVMIHLIREYGTMIESRGTYAGIPKVRAGAKLAGIVDFDRLVDKMCDDGFIAAYAGNPAKTEDKSTLYRRNGDLYCSLCEL